MIRRSCSSSVFVLFLLVILSSGVIHAESDDPGDTSSPFDVGLIFNIDGIIPQDIESYQGGFGVKLGKNSMAFKMLFDFFASASTDRTAFSLDAGTSFEYHFVNIFLSPYFGGYLSLGYATREEEISGDTWTSLRSFPISFGPLFGIEILIADFLSIFLEYALEIEYNIISIKTSILGSVTSERADEFSINTALGNNAKLGVIIYFLRAK